MKAYLLHSLLILFCVTVQAQTNPILGQYESQFNQGITTSDDVVVTRDPQSNKKIWISGILNEGKLYAILSLKNEDRQQYTIPKQTVNGKAIREGIINFSFDEDEEVYTIHISNDPKANPTNVSVSSKGVSVTDADGEDVVQVKSNGNVKVDADGNKVSTGKGGNVTASTGAKSPYFTYVGTKPVN